MEQGFWQYLAEYMEVSFSQYLQGLLDPKVLQQLFEFSCAQMFSEGLALIALMIFAHYTMGCKARKPFLVATLLWILVPIPVFFLRNIIIEELLATVYAGVGMILLKLAFPKLRLSHMLFVGAFLMGFSNISYGLVTSVIYPVTNSKLATILPTMLMVICVAPWIVLFVAKTRYAIRELITATPGKILLACGIFLILLYYLNLMLSPYGFFWALLRDLLMDNLYFAEIDTDPEYYNTPEKLAELIAFNESYMNWIEALLQAWYLFILQLLLCIVVPVVMVVTSSNKRLKKLNEDFEAQIQAQAEHYRNLADANAEVRRFRHDFKNLRFALEKLLSEGKKTEALAVMQEFSEALDSSKRFVMLFDTGNGIADALLTDKLHRAKGKQIALSFEGAIPSSALLPTDLCVLLGNTIDNAIEACEKLPEGIQRSITVECNCCGGFLFLTVRNPIDKPVAIRDNRVQTTKKDDALHGFGITSLHKVAKKYDGAVKLNADGGYFTVNVDLCLPAQALAG